MTRVHDMGGRFGDGPVEPERQGIPEFGEDWHARALAVTLASGALGKWNIDMSRRARECLAPKDYARFSYYEKWIAALTDLLVETGVLTRDDLNSEIGSKNRVLVKGALKREMVAEVLAKGSPADRVGGPKAKFLIGQTVRTRRPAANLLVEGGHTRLPSYASGALGRIVLHHGSHVLPDSSAHSLGEAAEPLYAVSFSASELWANPESEGDEVVLDLWQSYLIAA